MVHISISISLSYQVSTAKEIKEAALVVNINEYTKAYERPMITVKMEQKTKKLIQANRSS